MLCLLIVSGPLACTGLGVSTGGGGIGSMLAPLNQATGEKSSGNDGNLGNDSGGNNGGQDPGTGPSDPSASGSPDQPGQEGAGKPHPPGGGEPSTGGTIAANPSPAQPTQPGVGKCWSAAYLIRGKVRPQGQADAECVSFSSPPALTVLDKLSDGALVTHASVTGKTVDACGNFELTAQYCLLNLAPFTVRIDAIYGYQGVTYEALSDEITLTTSFVTPLDAVPAWEPSRDGTDEEVEDEFLPGNRAPRWDEGPLPNHFNSF